jgi:prepilin-type N-terminal cleavage/methylation domain-containing protein
MIVMKRQPAPPPFEAFCLCCRRGFTLIELTMSVFIIALVLVGVMEALLYVTAMGSINKTRTQAFQDAHMTMERITGVPFSELNNQFPNGQPLAADFVANVLGGYKLPSESISVSYPNGIDSNPREVLVNGTWIEKGVQRNLSLRTFRRG